MADIVLLFVLKGRDCMSKVLIEVLVIILIAGSYLILYSVVRVSAIADQRIEEMCCIPITLQIDKVKWE